MEQSKARVLVVEDEGIIARDIQKVLFRLGYDVAGPAGTGAEALAEVERRVPDIVLMDIKIRGTMDGVETAREIRRHHQIPIVFLTAHTDSNTLGRVTKTAPYGYVVKPFTEASIKVAVEVALSRRRAEREAQARQDWLHAALESITDAVVVTRDAAGTVQYLNQTAEELTGWTATEAHGHALSDVLRLDLVNNELTGSNWSAVLSSARKDRPFDFAGATLTRRSGDRQKVSGSAGPLHLSPETEKGGIIMILRPESDGSMTLPAGGAAVSTKLQELSHALTHDLREPVRNMTCFAQMLSRQTSSTALDPESQEYLRFIVEGSKRMDDLLVGLFRYHAAGDRPAERNARADATAAWTEAAAQLAESVRLSGAQVEVGELPEVAMDFSSLKDIFEALLSNALRFRSPGARPVIRAEAREEGKFWRITVADNGVGLDTNQVERVFGLFKKAHHQGLSGAGIGLSICRHLVELYGGRIWLESRPGQGAKAHFTIPAAAARNA